MKEFDEALDFRQSDLSFIVSWPDVFLFSYSFVKNFLGWRSIFSTYSILYII